MQRDIFGWQVCSSVVSKRVGRCYGMKARLGGRGREVRVHGEVGFFRKTSLVTFGQSSKGFEGMPGMTKTLR